MSRYSPIPAKKTEKRQAHGPAVDHLRGSTPHCNRGYEKRIRRRTVIADENSAVLFRRTVLEFNPGKRAQRNADDGPAIPENEKAHDVPDAFPAESAEQNGDCQGENRQKTINHCNQTHQQVTCNCNHHCASSSGRLRSPAFSVQATSVRCVPAPF